MRQAIHKDPCSWNANRCKPQGQNYDRKRVKCPKTGDRGISPLTNMLTIQYIRPRALGCIRPWAQRYLLDTSNLLSRPSLCNLEPLLHVDKIISCVASPSSGWLFFAYRQWKQWHKLIIYRPSHRILTLIITLSYLARPSLFQFYLARFSKAWSRWWLSFKNVG